MALSFKRLKKFTMDDINFNDNYRTKLKQVYKQNLINIYQLNYLLAIFLIALTIIFIITSYLFQGGLLGYLFALSPLVFFAFDILSYIKNVSSVKNLSDYECMEKYFFHEYRIDLNRDILSFNDLLIDNNNQIKRKYELLDVDSTNLNAIEFQQLNQFNDIDGILNKDQIKLIQRKAQHTELSLDKLYSILKNYVIVVEDNYKKKNIETINSLQISDSVDIYTKFENKYKGV